MKKRDNNAVGDDFIGRIVLLCGKKDNDFIEVLEDLSLKCQIVSVRSEEDITTGDVVIADRFLQNLPKPTAFAFIINEDFEDFGGDAENIITCGMSSKATVNISSKTESEIVLSIQNCIVNIFGEVIEPQDIILHQKRQTDDFILAASVAAMICVKGKNYL